MSEKKLNKGTYYSCPHQKLSNSSCNTCKQERERERERDEFPPQVETTFYSCNTCKKTILESEGSPGPSEDKSTVKEDCYLQGEIGVNGELTCAKHKEKNEDPNIPGPSSAIPNSVREYFKSNKVKSVKLKDNKWLITYKDKKETKTIPLANTPSQIQPLRAYFQHKNISSLDSSELENQQNQNSPDNPNKTNYLL